MGNPRVAGRTRYWSGPRGHGSFRWPGLSIKHHKHQPFLARSRVMRPKRCCAQMSNRPGPQKVSQGCRNSKLGDMGRK
jgi:hypothetical protein